MSRYTAPNLDAQVLQQALDWLASGEYPWLCVITATFGSSPRPVGSIFTCLDDGRQCGSLSGGCVEEDLLRRLGCGEFTGALPQALEYGLDATDSERLGLPCGGRITVLLQRLGPADNNWLALAIRAVAERRCVKRRLLLASGATQLSDCSDCGTLTRNDVELIQYFGPRLRMLLVGAGQLAQCLASLALPMDYDVVVTDPREDQLAQWQGPEVTLLQGMPDDVVRDLSRQGIDIVITLSHDPRIDDMALMQALETDAWYVGALGSARTTEKRLQRLAQLGLGREQLSQLYAPVGLPIGSRTPWEIAVAIMAELTQLRRSRGSR